MKQYKNIFRNHLFAGLFEIVSCFAVGQPLVCNLVVPPFSSSGIQVTHTLGINTEVPSFFGPSDLCLDTSWGNVTQDPVVYLGVYDNIDTLWNPFIYTLHFSESILSISFMITGSGTGFPAIDNGAENFVFFTDQANIALQSLFACQENISGDTIFIGDTLLAGSGLFSITFDCPVYEFTISGKGGGSGSGFKICSNSLTTPNLWGRISGDSLISSSQDSIVFNAFGGVAPYTFSYTVNGGAVQTLVSNTSQLSLPLPASNGTYTYNLLQVQDGNDSVAVIGCNSEFVAVVNFVHIVELDVLSFSLSPNPAKEELYISASNYFEENTDIQITDMEGRIVLETKYQLGEAFDISGLKSGLYFLRIESEKGWVAKRFVKL